MDALTVILTFIVILVAVYYFFKHSDRFEKDGIPYIKPMPILGNIGPAILFRKSFAEVLNDVYNFNKKAKYVGFYDFSCPTIVIRDPELIKEIGIKHFEYFVNHREVIDPAVDPLFGNNLFALKDDKWREMRTILSPSFTSSKMKLMFELIVNCAKNFTNYFIEMSKEEGRTVTINSKDAFGKYTNDVIATCAYGIATDSLRNPDNEFYKIGTKYCTVEGVLGFKFFVLRSFPTISKIFDIKCIPAKANAFFNRILRETITMRDQKGIHRPDMIQLMMETRNNKPSDLSMQDMSSQAFVFFLAGFDTARGLLCFVAHMLSANPEVQTKLREEVDEVYKNSNGKPTYDMIKNMEYFDAVVNETQRLYPAAVILDRICGKDFELPPPLPGAQPVKLKRGDTVWFPVYGIHHDPAYFPEPEKFMPERFIENKSLLTSPYYLPFGIGPRACIGNRFALMKVKVIIFYLLLNCELKLSKKMKMPLKLRPGIETSADGGFWLDIEPRKR